VTRLLIGDNYHSANLLDKCCGYKCALECVHMRGLVEDEKIEKSVRCQASLALFFRSLLSMSERHTSAAQFSASSTLNIYASSQLRHNNMMS
jgi:hypothetical protein